jgi:hypothetical protein
MFVFGLSFCSTLSLSRFLAAHEHKQSFLVIELGWFTTRGYGPWSKQDFRTSIINVPVSFSVCFGLKTIFGFESANGAKIDCVPFVNYLFWALCASYDSRLHLVFVVFMIALTRTCCFLILWDGCVVPVYLDCKILVYRQHVTPLKVLNTMKRIDMSSFLNGTRFGGVSLC